MDNTQSCCKYAYNHIIIVVYTSCYRVLETGIVTFWSRPRGYDAWLPNITLQVRDEVELMLFLYNDIS